MPKRGILSENLPEMERYSCLSKRFRLEQLPHPLPLFDLSGQRWNYLVEVAHYTQVRELEDGGIWVFVDGDDGVGGLHSNFVLDFA